MGPEQVLSLYYNLLQEKEENLHRSSYRFPQASLMPHLKDRKDSWGWISIWLHWLMAIAIPALYGLGLWLDEHSYYDAWFSEAITAHFTIGMIAMLLLLSRLLWRLPNPRPEMEGEVSAAQRRARDWGHHLLYLSMITAVVSGYFYGTSEGDALVLFFGLEVPAITALPDEVSENLAFVHERTADILIILAIGHIAMAVYHSVRNGDNRTLMRMLRP